MTSKRMPQLNAIQDLIWIQTSFLGDIILQTAALHYIQQHYPHIRQHLITTPIGAKALAGHPSITSLMVFDKRQRSLYAAVKTVKQGLKSLDARHSVVLQAHRSVRSSLLAWSIGLPTVTYHETELSFLADVRVSRVAVLHETKRIALLLEPLGARREDLFASRPMLTSPETPVLKSVWPESRDHPIIGIAPGSVWGTKRWPIRNFIDLGRSLLQATDARLVILGSADEQAAADELEAGLSHESNRVINLAGKTDLDDLRSLYPHLTLLVSNDSSPLHYASAFQVPTVAIFGATVPALGFGPLTPGSQVAEIDLVCRPCSDHGPQICPLGHFKCMRELQPARVAQLVLRTLEASHRISS